MFQFKNLTQFVNHFSDEKTCRDYLEYRRWQGSPICPHCGSKRVYRIKESHVFKCGNKRTCDKKFSVTTKTVFESSKLPLSLWFQAIFLATSHKKGISSCQLARDLGITQKSAWFMLHRIRLLITPNNPQTLSGEVTVDETYIKGKAANRTKKIRKEIQDGIRKDEATIAVGLVEPKGEGILKVVPNAEGKTLKAIVKGTVTDKYSVIITDGLSAYNGVGEGYLGHVAVNHILGEYVVGKFSTNAVEGFFSHFKRTILGTYHYVTPKHMQRYCDLFTFRYNTRKQTEPERFHNTLNNPHNRLKYHVLIDKKTA